MTERKPANQSWEGFAEQRIRAAQEAGDFDQLPGAGKPIPGIEQPLQENWWLKEKLKREKLAISPPLVEARLEIERVRRELLLFQSESIVRAKLFKLQQFVNEAIMSPVPSPPIVVLPINIEQELRRWRAQSRHAE